jgi:hypothetical protein
MTSYRHILTLPKSTAEFYETVDWVFYVLRSILLKSFIKNPLSIFAILT